MKRTLNKSFLKLFHSNLYYRNFSTVDQLTSTRFKGTIFRGNYSKLDEKDLTFFESILQKSQVVTDSHDLIGYNVDWLKSLKGASKLLLRPKKTEEISAILRYCNERKLAVCPQGGNTGIVGGSVPVFDEIILSTSLMNQIISFDELSGVLVCEAGCILEKTNDYLSDRGFIMPLDLGAKGSCQIGGNVSTNAGGLRVVRYGSLHSTVLGLEVVLPNGTILDNLSTMKKDNTGYDLKHLFIGAEGTLGVVTKIAIQCSPKPKATNLTFLGLSKYENVLETFKRGKRELGEVLSACEYIDEASLLSVKENLKLKSPIDPYPYYMMIETSGSNENHDKEKLEKFLESNLADGTVSDGVVASEPSHIHSIWSIRERLPEALMIDGHFYIYDFSMNITLFDECIILMQKHLGKSVKRCTGFGHLGDSNLHLNITTREKEYDPKITAMIEPFVYEWIAKQRGSISSEHGIGFKKRAHLHYSRSKESISLMKEIKSLIDPNGILNPYKVI